MSTPPLVTIGDVDAIVNRDRLNHLHCRKQQLLAYLGSRTPDVDLLLYGALGNTFDIYRHCYLRRRYRWAYPTPYLTDEDLPLLGYVPLQLGKAELADLPAGLARLRQERQPLFFYAPRADFPHWVEFMRRTGTIESEYRELHSFLVAGATDTGDPLLIVDNTTDNHDFRRYLVPLDVITAGYTREPERWFVDCATLVHTGTAALDELHHRYHRTVADFADDFSLYHVIADSFPTERSAFPEAYRTPSVNSLALLAGSRDFFLRFLHRTDHREPVVAAYRNLTEGLVRALAGVTRYQAGAADIAAAGLRRELHRLRQVEQRSRELLLADHRRGVALRPADVSRTAVTAPGAA